MKTEIHTVKSNPRIDWLKVGKSHSEGHENKIIKIISRMEWDFDFVGKDLPMGPALCIKETIKQLKLPKVSAISYSCNELAPYGFYGVEANYKNSKIRIFVVDEGSETVPVCVFVWDKPIA